MGLKDGKKIKKIASGLIPEMNKTWRIEALKSLE